MTAPLRSAERAAAPARDPAPVARPVPRAAPPLAPRGSLVRQGLAGALAGVVLLLAAVAGPVALAAGVFALSLLLSAALLVVADAPARGGALVLAGGATAVAAGLALRPAGVDGLAGVAAMALVAALLRELGRRDRSQVTESLADTLLVVVLGLSAACLVAAGGSSGGPSGAALPAALGAVAVCLLVGRAADAAVPRPTLVRGGSRGWAGLVLGPLAAAGTAVAVSPSAGADLPAVIALGLAVGGAAAAADLGVDVAAVERRAAGADRRRTAALRPVRVLLPYAVVGPVVLLVARAAPGLGS